MTCAEALELMLEADLPDVEPGSDTELGRHLRQCESCRTAAERILGAEGALREHLAAAGPRRPTEAALRAGLTRRARLAHLARLAVPLAAAASLIVFFVTRRPSIAPGEPPPIASRPSIAVTAPPGRSVAVLRTDNPDVVVFWFF